MESMTDYGFDVFVLMYLVDDSLYLLRHLEGGEEHLYNIRSAKMKSLISRESSFADFCWRSYSDKRDIGLVSGPSYERTMNFFYDKVYSDEHEYVELINNRIAIKKDCYRKFFYRVGKTHYVLMSICLRLINCNRKKAKKEPLFSELVQANERMYKADNLEIYQKIFSFEFNKLFELKDSGNSEKISAYITDIKKLLQQLSVIKSEMGEVNNDDYVDMVEEIESEVRSILDNKKYNDEDSIASFRDIYGKKTEDLFQKYYGEFKPVLKEMNTFLNKRDDDIFHK